MSKINLRSKKILGELKRQECKIKTCPDRQNNEASFKISETYLFKTTATKVERVIDIVSNFVISENASWTKNM